MDADRKISQFDSADPDDYYGPASTEALERYRQMKREGVKPHLSIHELCRLALREGIERDEWRRSVRQSLRKTLGLPTSVDGVADAGRNRA